MSSTREKILDAALRETAKGDAVPSMSLVARTARISRQALYLHFPSRAALMLALVEHVDRREGLAAAIEAVENAPDAPAQVRAWTRMQAERNPRIAALARALDASRHEDDAAAQAWRDRAQNRMRGARALVERLRAEGRLHESWDAEEAALLLWELISFRVWDDLVAEAGVGPDRYVDLITATALAALAAPSPAP